MWESATFLIVVKILNFLQSIKEALTPNYFLSPGENSKPQKKNPNSLSPSLGSCRYPTDEWRPDLLPSSSRCCCCCSSGAAAIVVGSLKFNFLSPLFYLFSASVLLSPVFDRNFGTVDATVFGALCRRVVAVVLGCCCRGWPCGGVGCS